MYSNGQEKRLLEKALEWADQACRLAENQRNRGNYRFLAQLHPAIRSYFGESYYRRGTGGKGLPPMVWAAVHPEAARAIVGMYANYGHLTRLEEAFNPSKLAKMSDEEIAGLLDYITRRVRDKAEMERTIAGKTPEELQELIDQIRAELAKRAQAAQKEAEKNKPAVTAESLAARGAALTEAKRPTVAQLAQRVTPAKLVNLSESALERLGDEIYSHVRTEADLRRDDLAPIIKVYWSEHTRRWREIRAKEGRHGK